MGKSKKKKSGVGLWMLGVIVFVAAAGGAYYYLTNFAGVEPPKKPSKPPHVTVSEERTYVVYLPKETSQGFILAPSPRTMGGEGSIVDAAVQALLATTEEPGLAGNLIPKGTRLLTPVKLEKGIATVDLSQEFVDNFSGGSDLEVLTLNALVATVVDSSGGKADRVKILVEGKSVDSIGGHMDMTEPLTPDPEIVKSEKIK
jgi:spore germination protein GerM